jgi:leucyl-tRNA synthetase
MPRYNPATIEPKWQKYWEENQTFQTPEMPSRRKTDTYFDMFPYPSGEGSPRRTPRGIHGHRYRLPL